MVEIAVSFSSATMVLMLVSYAFSSAPLVVIVGFRKELGVEFDWPVPDGTPAPSVGALPPSSERCRDSPFSAEAGQRKACSLPSEETT